MPKTMTRRALVAGAAALPAAPIAVQAAPQRDPHPAWLVEYQRASEEGRALNRQMRKILETEPSCEYDAGIRLTGPAAAEGWATSPEEIGRWAERRKADLIARFGASGSAERISTSCAAIDAQAKALKVELQEDQALRAAVRARTGWDDLRRRRDAACERAAELKELMLTTPARTADGCAALLSMHLGGLRQRLDRDADSALLALAASLAVEVPAAISPE